MTLRMVSGGGLFDKINDSCLKKICQKLDNEDVMSLQAACPALNTRVRNLFSKLFDIINDDALGIIISHLDDSQYLTALRRTCKSLRERVTRLVPSCAHPAVALECLQHQPLFYQRLSYSSPSKHHRGVILASLFIAPRSTFNSLPPLPDFDEDLQLHSDSLPLRLDPNLRRAFYFAARIHKDNDLCQYLQKDLERKVLARPEKVFPNFEDLSFNLFCDLVDRNLVVIQRLQENTVERWRAFFTNVDGLKDEPILAELAIFAQSGCIEFLLPLFQDNRSVVRAMVQVDGGVLGRLDPIWRDDTEIVFEAAKENGFAYLSATDRCRSIRRIAWEAFGQYGGALAVAPDAFKDDENLVRRALRWNGWVARFASPRLRNSKSLMTVAVRKCSWAFRHASPPLQEDHELRRLAFLETRANDASPPCLFRAVLCAVGSGES